MPKLTHNQNNFTAGELSPRMRARGDVARYQNGAERIENGVVMVHGGVRRRDGLRFLAVAKLGGERRVRLLRYVFNVDQAYVLELGHLYVRIFDGVTGAVILDGNTGLPLELASPYTEDQVAVLTTKQNADGMYLFHEQVATHLLQRLTPTLWTLQPVRWVTEPFAETGHQPDAKLGLSAATVGTGRTFTTSATVVPGQPLNVVATPLNASARVAFDPPTADGGDNIVRYTVTASPGGATAIRTGSPIIVPGLTNGVAYTFTVTATNRIGTGTASAASNSVTPLASLPGGPLAVTWADSTAYKLNGPQVVPCPQPLVPGAVLPIEVTYTRLSGDSEIQISPLTTNDQLYAASRGYNDVNTMRVRASIVDANGSFGFADSNQRVVHRPRNPNDGEVIP